MARLATDPESACYVIWAAWALSWWLAALWSSRAESRASVAEQVPYRLLNISGFVLLFAVQTRRYHGPLRLWTLPTSAGWAMATLCLVGFAFAWWARIHLGRLWSAFVTRKADHHIIDTGPYGLVRHPIYTGILLALLATALLKPGPWGVAGFALLAISFVIKARLEERFLMQELGAEAYAGYRRRVPMLVPFWPVSRG